MEKEIKKILKKHSMFRDQENGCRVFTLYKDKWSDVAKDIESLVKKSNDIQNVIVCPKCDNPYPHRHRDNRMSCEECGNVWDAL